MTRSAGGGLSRHTGISSRSAALPHPGRGGRGWLPSLAAGREQVSCFFPAHGRKVCEPGERPTVSKGFALRDGAIPYAEAGSWVTRSFFGFEARAKGS
jgi:hypothetical protein